MGQNERSLNQNCGNVDCFCMKTLQWKRKFKKLLTTELTCCGNKSDLNNQLQTAAISSSQDELLEVFINVNLTFIENIGD